MIRLERKHNDEENYVFNNTHFYSTSPSTKEAIKGALATLTDGVMAQCTAVPSLKQQVHVFDWGFRNEPNFQVSCRKDYVLPDEKAGE